MSGDDMFRLFQANANGMEEFARLTAGGSRATGSGSLPTPSGFDFETAVEVEAEREELVAIVPAAKAPAGPSWWERVGLVPAVRRPRRRLTQMSMDIAAMPSGH